MKTSDPGQNQQSDPKRKARFTTYLPAELLDRVKNAVYWTPGLTVSGLAEEAINAVLKKLEKTHGGQFATRSQPLKRGRRLK